jgi:type IV pilus assembly protein PilP
MVRALQVLRRAKRVENQSRGLVIQQLGHAVKRVSAMASVYLIMAGSAQPTSSDAVSVRLLSAPRWAYALPLQPLLVAQQTDSTGHSYRYETQGRRDPFETLVKEKQPIIVEPGPVIDPNRPRGPLERFDLSALKLMGIVWGERGRRAVIRAPDGKGYFVTVGMYMGQNGGKVIAIEEDQLIIEEKHRDQQGDIIGKTLTIQLRRKEKQQG